MRKERKLLCRQLELLAEQSKVAMEKDLSEMSDSMCEIYKLLNYTVFTIAAQFAVYTYLVVGFLVLLKKLFRCKS